MPVVVIQRQRVNRKGAQRQVERVGGVAPRGQGNSDELALAQDTFDRFREALSVLLSGFRANRANGERGGPRDWIASQATLPGRS